MKIWITRHGQTNLNLKKLMQGLTDEPLNDTGIAQAEAARQSIGAIHFDAVYASPLQRAVRTGAIIGGISEKDVIRDKRIIETDFGRYEKKRYYALGPAMTLYWALPELFPAPKTVESTTSMTARAQAFLKEIENQSYENVLIACHGGIMRALCGYMEDRSNGLMWRPKPHNCEIRIYESDGGKHRRIDNNKGKGDREI